MKSTIKLLLIGIIFAGSVLADGDMGNGGYTCEGDMGNGGRICPTECTECEEINTQANGENASESDSDNSILSAVQTYLNELFGTGI